MSPFGLKFSQMILHTETSNLMYNWSFLFIFLHKPTLLPSTFNPNPIGLFWGLESIGGGGGLFWPPPPISATNGPIDSKIGTVVKQVK